MFLGYSRVFYGFIFLTPPLNTQLNIMTRSYLFKIRENELLHTQLHRCFGRLRSQVMRHLRQQLLQAYYFESQRRSGLSEISKRLNYYLSILLKRVNPLT